jgi:hypothetical protein
VIITLLIGVCRKERPSETYKLDSRPTWHRENCYFRSDCISHGQTRPGASRSNFIFPIISISFCYYTYDNKFFCQVLVCAPSNVAVDQLAEKISATGLKVMKKSFACSYANILKFIYFFYLFVVLFIVISGHYLFFCACVL